MRKSTRVSLVLAYCAAVSCAYSATYNVTAIPLPAGSSSPRIAAMNAAGQIVGSFANGSQNVNFLYTPGAGTTNIERTGSPDPATYEGSSPVAINSTGQILLYSGALYSYQQATPKQLGPVIVAAFPTETLLTFNGLNDKGEVSGTAQLNSGPESPFSEDIFRYTPEGSVTSVAHTTNRRAFPAGGGPFKLDDAGDVVDSEGDAPYGAVLFLANGTITQTGCGEPFNGFATVISNSGLIGGVWPADYAGPGQPYPTSGLAICNFSGETTFLNPQVMFQGGTLTALNDFGDAVGQTTDANGNVVYALFTQGQVISVNSLFPAGSGWVTTSVNAINDAGEIAGIGTVNGVGSAFVLSPAPAASYTLQMLCPSISCAGYYALSQSGAVAASTPLATYIYTPGQSLTSLPAGYLVRAINASGVIAGQDQSLHAFVSAPPYTSFENLNSVCGWMTGSAVGVSDGDDVLGDGDSNCSSAALEGLSGLYLYQINNANQVTGSWLNNLNSLVYFLYTPGVGMEVLPAPPVGLSNSGHVLVGTPNGGGYSIVGSDGTVQLPAGYYWRALNDLDQVVGQTPDASTAVFYSAATGVVNISSLVQGSQYSVNAATAINDAGEILATIDGPASLTSALLIPGANATSLSSVPATAASGTSRVRTRTMNGRPMAVK